ncbi:MAG: hypothetical protein R2795_17725 [Saprospiraceae bacterium]
MSSAYFRWCTGFYTHAANRMEATLARDHIQATRYTLCSTILNSLLWQGTSRKRTASITWDVLGYWTKNLFSNYHEPKTMLLAGHEQDPHVSILRWFSDGYYQVIPTADGKLVLNDLRFGIGIACWWYVTACHFLFR